MISGTSRLRTTVVKKIDQQTYSVMGKFADQYIVDQYKGNLARMINDQTCLVCLGEPTDYDIISINDACGIVKKMIEDTNGDISIEVHMLPNEKGNMAKEIISLGSGFAVSSRGYARTMELRNPWYKRVIRWIGKLFGKNWYVPKKRIVDGISLIGYDLISTSSLEL